MTRIILTKSIVVRRTYKQSSGQRLLPQQECDLHHFACAQVLCLGYEDDINTHRQHITQQHNKNTVNTHSPSPLSALLDWVSPILAKMLLVVKTLNIGICYKQKQSFPLNRGNFLQTKTIFSFQVVVWLSEWPSGWCHDEGTHQNCQEGRMKTWRWLRACSRIFSSRARPDHSPAGRLGGNRFSAAVQNAAAPGGSFIQMHLLEPWIGK